MAEYPSNFAFSAGTLSWTNAPDTVWLEVVYAHQNKDDWNVCYSGNPTTNCSFTPTSGDYAVKGKRRKRDGVLGVYGPPTIIHV